jgi:MarR family transcriptional regulator, organic hydroperoxide resistance regulator
MAGMVEESEDGSLLSGGTIMSFEQLRLDNQICFPIYAAARLFAREYQPYLEALGITYPQYLVMLVLWETDQLTVGEIAEKLLLNTNTITPLLKRMEAQELLLRQRSEGDERKVIISLTTRGRQLQERAADIPVQFVSGLLSQTMSLEDLISLKDKLSVLIDQLNRRHSETP